MNQTTIDIFFKMNPNYQRLVLSKLWHLVDLIHHELAALNTFTTDIKYNFDDIDENKEMAREKLIKWEEAEELNRIKIDEVKALNKKRLPFIRRSFMQAQALQNLITDPKKAAIFLRTLELKDKLEKHYTMTGEEIAELKELTL